VSVDRGRDHTYDHPDDAADQREQDGLRQELDAYLSPGSAQRAPQPDLLPPFQHRDDHDVGHPDRADQQRDRSQTEEQRVERAGRVGLSRQRAGGLGHVDPAGVGWIGLVAEQVVDSGGDRLAPPTRSPLATSPAGSARTIP
jgi:hypothetical protein